jgi:hypothetical protein
MRFDFPIGIGWFVDELESTLGGRTLLNVVDKKLGY